MKTAAFIKKELLTWLLVLAPFVFSCIFWNQVPDVMPTHWDYNGHVNGYSSRAFGMLFIPFLNLGLYFLFLLLPRIDPRKANYAQFKTTYTVFRLVVHAFLCLVFILPIVSTMGYPVNINIVSRYGILIFFLILGNFMGKIRPNYFIGVRTPWTLANEQVWVKTHRLTGKVWVGASLVYLVLSLVVTLPSWCMLLYTGMLVVVPILGSYLIFRKVQPEG